MQGTQWFDWGARLWAAIQAIWQRGHYRVQYVLAHGDIRLVVVLVVLITIFGTLAVFLPFVWFMDAINPTWDQGWGWGLHVVQPILAASLAAVRWS